VERWSFLTNHARVLLRIAQDPGARLRDIAAALGITERSAYGIVTDLAAAGYVVKHKDGRRNRYQVQAHLPLPEPASQEPAIGDVLAVSMGDSVTQEPAWGRPGHARPLAAAQSPGQPGPRPAAEARQHPRRFRRSAPSLEARKAVAPAAYLPCGNGRSVAKLHVSPGTWVHAAGESV
jgi:hypothetical protein